MNKETVYMYMTFYSTLNSLQGCRLFMHLFLHTVYHLLFCVQLSLGAVQSHGLQKPILSNKNFHGCLENLLYNDLNLIDLAKKNNHQVSVVVSYCVSAPLEHHYGNLPFSGHQKDKEVTVQIC